MRNIEKRLEALSRVFGCPVHGEALCCAVCEGSEPMPEWAQSGINRLLDHIIARVSKQDLRIAFGRVLPPISEPCPTCEGRRSCAECTTTFAKGLFAAIGLTPQEDAALKTLMAKVRAFDAGR